MAAWSVERIAAAGVVNVRRRNNPRRRLGDVTSATLIAIVDDDASVRLAVESLVKSLGHTTVTFASAEAFLQAKSFGRVGCLITDIKMPGMTGIQLQDALLVRGEHVPIIFITAYPEARVRDQVLAAGAVCFLGKPFDSADMIRCLAIALRQGGTLQR
jgi:FixJ family two-component response regulator